MWAAQAFMLYGGEPTLSSQIQMMGRGAIDTQGNRSYLNIGGHENNQSPQMFMSTPMPNTVGHGVNRLMENTTTLRPFQNNQYTLSPSLYTT